MIAGFGQFGLTSMGHPHTELDWIRGILEGKLGDWQVVALSDGTAERETVTVGGERVTQEPGKKAENKPETATPQVQDYNSVIY